MGSLPLMTAANTEKMHALDYPGLSEDKTPEAFFRRVEAAATHEKSKEAMRAFMRRSTALLMTAGHCHAHHLHLRIRTVVVRKGLP